MPAALAVTATPEPRPIGDADGAAGPTDQRHRHQPRMKSAVPGDSQDEPVAIGFLDPSGHPVSRDLATIDLRRRSDGGGGEGRRLSLSAAG